MKRLLRTILAIAGSGMVALFTALPASATEIVTLGNGLCTGGCGPAPYGTVTLNDSVAGSVTVTVTLNSPYRFTNTCCDAFAWNLSGSPSLVGAVSGLTSGFSLVSTTAGSLHEDGAGDFMYGIACTICGSGGSNPNPGPLSFSLTLTGITTSSFISNTSGYRFVVDLCAYNVPASSTSGGLQCGNTGAATNGSSSSSSSSSSSTGSGGGGGSGNVPEPSSSALALLGVALLGYTMLRRKSASRA